MIEQDDVDFISQFCYSHMDRQYVCLKTKDKVGFILHPSYEDPKYRVRVGNIFKVSNEGIDCFTLPFEDFPTPQAILEAGWEID